MENGGRVKVGAKVLSEWLRIHRVTVGDIWGDTFVRLIARKR